MDDVQNPKSFAKLNYYKCYQSTLDFEIIVKLMFWENVKKKKAFILWEIINIKQSIRRWSWESEHWLLRGWFLVFLTL